MDILTVCFRFMTGIWNIIQDALPYIVSTYVGARIVRKTFLPKVVIKTKKEHILRDEGGCFLSLNLVNIGPNVAQNCCAYIILDHPVDSEQFLNPNEATTDEHLPCYVQENPNFEVPRNTLITRDKRRDVQQIELCWTHHGNPYHKDLNPGVQTHIDICRYQLSPDKTNRHYIIFPTERGWRRVHFRLWYQELRGRLYVCPANSYPNIFDISFGLDTSGNPEMSLKKLHLNIFTKKKYLLK